MSIQPTPNTPFQTKQYHVTDPSKKYTNTTKIICIHTQLTHKLLFSSLLALLCFALLCFTQCAKLVSLQHALSTFSHFALESWDTKHSYSNKKKYTLK